MPITLMAQGVGGEIRRPVRANTNNNSPKDRPINTSTNKVNGHEFVDLGLSVKWATCNIGASSPQASGYYYAWGEISTKETFNGGTYKYNLYENGFLKLTKYCTNSYYGYVDNKTNLDDIDDVALNLWGEKWRIPSVKEFKELINNCSWQEHNGSWKVIGPNGNFIIIPYGGYWSNEISDDCTVAKALYWRKITGIWRDRGLYVRPVIKIQ